MSSKKAIPVDDAVELSKSRVKKFFKKLESSPLRKLMEFQNTQEKIEAIIKFADIVGIPESRLGSLLSSIRKKLK